MKGGGEAVMKQGSKSTVRKRKDETSSILPIACSRSCDVLCLVCRRCGIKAGVQNAIVVHVREVVATTTAENSRHAVFDSVIHQHSQAASTPRHI